MSITVGIVKKLTSVSFAFSSILPRKSARSSTGVGLRFIEQETLIYKIIDGCNIAPGFLGHLTEGDRVVGILLEYIDDARQATVNDIEGCSRVLTQLHELKICHNDINLYNFLVRRSSGHVLLCDFECCDTQASNKKLEEEQRQLAETLKHDFRVDEDDWSLYGRNRLGHEGCYRYWM